MTNVRRLILLAVASLALAGLAACSYPNPPSAENASRDFIVYARKGDFQSMCKMLTDYSRAHLTGGCDGLGLLYIDIIDDPGHPAIPAAGVKKAPAGARGLLQVTGLEIHGDQADAAIVAAYPSAGRFDSIRLIRKNSKWLVDLFPDGAGTALLRCARDRASLISARDHYVRLNHHFPANAQALVNAGFLPMRSIHVDLNPDGTVTAMHGCT